MTTPGWTVHLRVRGTSHAAIMDEVVRRLEAFWPSEPTDRWHLSGDVEERRDVSATGFVHSVEYVAQVTALRVFLPPEEAADDEGDDDDGEVQRVRGRDAMGGPPVQREGRAPGP